MPRRSIVLAASLAAAAAWAVPALAHSHLESASITEGAAIGAAPDELTLTFEEPVALAGATLEMTNGAPVALDFTPSPEEAATHAVALPALEPGGYAFTWRALGEDGHVLSETIHFTVTGDAHAGMHDADHAEHMQDMHAHMAAAGEGGHAHDGEDQHEHEHEHY